MAAPELFKGIIAISSAAAGPWRIQDPFRRPEHSADWPGAQPAAGKQQCGCTAV